MDFRRAQYDFEYIFLNFFVNKIPSWSIRKKCYQMLGMTIGKGARIGIGTVVMEPRKIVIGERSIINEFCHLDGRGGIKIGNDTSISVYTTILSASHKVHSNKFEYYEKKTTIGNNVWMGARAVVLDGSRINNQAVIGAGCVFKGTAEKGMIYIGKPATCRGERQLEREYKVEYKPYFR